MNGLFLFKLAIKNLTRHKRRTFITVFALAIGIAVFILLDSMLIGTRVESEINLIRYEMGSAKLVTSDYWDEWDERPLSSSIENHREVIQALEDRGIQAVGRTVINSTMVLNTGIGGSLPVQVIGLDVVEDGNVFRILDSVSSGRVPEPDEEALIMGSWMAMDLQLDVGDVVSFRVVDREGGNEVMEAEIVGLIDTPDPMVNRLGIYMPLETLDYYLFMEDSVTEISLSYPHGMNNRASESSAQEVSQQFGLELHSWEDWSQDYISASEGDKYGSFVILLLIFVIAAVGFSNTLLMALLERVPETGMMRALGMTRRELQRLFLLESLLQGFSGAILGILIGAVFNIPMVRNGFDFSDMMREMSVGYRFTGVMYGVWAASSYVVSLISGVFIAFAVSWFSIKKALKLKITDSIRGK